VEAQRCQNPAAEFIVKAGCVQAMKFCVTSVTLEVMCSEMSRTRLDVLEVKLQPPAILSPYSSMPFLESNIQTPQEIDP